MGKHKVISRFGLMHMVATNLCEWLYTLVEETKHEIWHLSHSHEPHTHEAITHSENFTPNTNITLSHNATIEHNLLKRSTVVSPSQGYEDCQRTNIMGSLVIIAYQG